MYARNVVRIKVECTQEIYLCEYISENTYNKNSFIQSYRVEKTVYAALFAFDHFFVVIQFLLSLCDMKAPSTNP